MVSYDRETATLSWKKSPNVNTPAGKICGNFDRHGYRVFSLDNCLMLGHRVVWMLHYGTTLNSDLDHINGIRSDNRIENLRLATPGQNAANRNLSRNNTSGSKGVTLHATGKWQAQLQHEGKNYYLGLHVTRQAAADAYAAKAKILFGEFANLGRAP